MTTAAIAIAVLFVALWLLAGAIKDVSIVDIAWGSAFVVAAWASHIASDFHHSPAGRLLLLCVTLWGLRLAVHIGRRNLGHGEDHRYAAMRAKRPDTFWVRSLVTVFLLQGALVLLIGWPVIAAQDRDGGSIGALSIAGLLLWAVGLFFEAVGDLQLTRFKADPANKGKVMDRGLWRYTRHPNYFGDATVWFGLWLMALECGVSPVTVISPLLMLFFIYRISGVMLMERHMAKREKYADYIATTSIFIPLPPKRQP